MSNFIEIKTEELNISPFELIGHDWMLITAEKDGKANTMTASWGGLGVMWGKNVAYTVVRPQRYTKEFIENSETFSLSFFDPGFKKQLSYLGSISGREEDKIKKSGLTLMHVDSTPSFEEASVVIVCKKLYAQDFKPEFFIEKEHEEKWYPNKDYHKLYISEVIKILKKV
nr:flavin reductase [Sedimentibacter sp.]